MPYSPSLIFVRGLLVLMLACTLCLAFIYWNLYGDAKLFADFEVFHTAARHAVLHQWMQIYDVDTLKSLMKPGASKELSFFLNPPTGLLLIYPLGYLNLSSALLVWSATQLVLLCAVLRMKCMQLVFAPLQSPAANTSVLLAITFMAFALLNFLYGQIAVLCSVLFLLVFLWRKSHPVLAGILLGIFCIKPQLGLLLPLLLVAEKNWTALAAGMASACALTALSVLIFGTGLWQDYRETADVLRYFLFKDQSALFSITTSAYAGLRNLGIPAEPALYGQALLALAVMLYSWPVLRKGKEPDKILILTLATYLVTPYSLVYDMVLLAVPCALLLRRAEANRAALPELLALVLLILMPLVAILLQSAHIPYSVIAIGLSLIVARRFIVNEQRG